MLSRLPDDCLLAVAGAATLSDACLLSMASARMRRLLPSARTLDAAACLRSLGWPACRALGCPRTAGVTEALALAGDREGLALAAGDCPVGPATAAVGAERGDMELLVWAWRRGAALDASVARRLGPAPENVVRWLVLQGCPAEHGAAAMASGDNEAALRVLAASGRMSPASWAGVMRAAEAAGAARAAGYLAGRFGFLRGAVLSGGVP